MTSTHLKCGTYLKQTENDYYTIFSHENGPALSPIAAASTTRSCNRQLQLCLFLNFLGIIWLSSFGQELLTTFPLHRKDPGQFTKGKHPSQLYVRQRICTPRCLIAACSRTADRHRVIFKKFGPQNSSF